MAIFPSVIPSSFSFGIKYNTQINISGLSGVTQTIEVPGARWAAEMSFDDLEPYEARVLAAFIVELRGASGRFKLYDFTHTAPRGLATGAEVVTVNGANQIGSSIETTWAGAASDVTGLLEPGDYIELEGNEVKMVTSTVTSVGGAATINFAPPIRNSPSNASSIGLTKCETVMLAASDENSWSTNNVGLLTNFSISCVEGFY